MLASARKTPAPSLHSPAQNSPPATAPLQNKNSATTKSAFCCSAAKSVELYIHHIMDMRESPTLQLLESQKRHLATGLKVYDPFITKDVVKNQYHDFDAFLADIDMVGVMVKHTEIRENVDKLAGKVVLDFHNIIDLPGVYHI